MNPMAAQDPNYVLQMLQAQRAQRMAEMLTEQGAAPIQYDHNGAISWTQGLAKMLQAYTGAKVADSANKQQADVQAQGAQRMMQMFQPQQLDPQQAQEKQLQDASVAAMNSPGNAGAGPTQQAAQLGRQIQGQMGTPTTTSRPAAMNPAGWNPQFAAMGYSADPAAYLKAQAEAIAPTNDMKNWQAQGVNPQQLAAGTLAQNAALGKTPEIQNAEYMGKTKQQMLAASLAADAKNGEIERKAKNEFRNFYTGENGIVPTIPDYANPVGAVAPNGSLPGGVAQMPGALPIAAATTGANQGAKEVNSVHTAIGPDGKPVTGFLFNNAQAAAPEQIRIMQAELADPKTQDADKPAIQREIARLQGTITGPDPTVQVARTQQQTDMAAKWKDLNGVASNAQAVNSRLDTIQDLATRASTGQFADKLQFVNSLLSMAGSERATDANTAKVLIDKNANQIVAQLGQGGLATDAARAILTSAYPNSHMPQEAITEASNNLKAVNNMMAAKASVLAPHYQANDPVGYQQKEQAFNAAADPRIYQWKAMASNPPAQAAYAKKLMQQDPTIVDKIKTLQGLGAIQ